MAKNKNNRQKSDYKYTGNKKTGKGTFSSNKAAKKAVNKKGGLPSYAEAGKKLAKASSTGKTGKDVALKRTGKVGSGSTGVLFRYKCAQKAAQIDHFDIDIEWYSGTVGQWIETGNRTASVNPDSEAASWYTYTFNAENDVDCEQIRARVRPVSKTYSAQEDYYEPKKKTITYKDKKGKKHKKSVWVNEKKTRTSNKPYFTTPGYSDWAVLSPAPALEDSQDEAKKLRTKVPERPSEPTATLQSNGDVEVSFEAIDAEQAGNERRVFRCMDGEYESAGDDVSGAITENGTSRFVDTGALDGHEYRYYIQAYNNRSKPSLVSAGLSLPTDLCEPVRTPPVDVSWIYASCFGADSAEVSFLYDAYFPAITSAKIYYADSLELLTTNKTANSSVEVSLGFQEMSAIVTGLDAGKTWYFAAWIKTGDGEQCELFSEMTASCTIATTPDPPTILALPKAAYVGESVEVQWTHNNADGSAQTAAQVSVTANAGGGNPSTTVYDVRGDEFYTVFIDPERFSDSSTCSIKVRTMGTADEFSEWSEDVEMIVYAKPSSRVSIQDASAEGPYGKRISKLPVRFDMSVSAKSGALSQSVTQWRLVLTAKEKIDYVDGYGNDAVIAPSEVVSEIIVDTNDEDFTQPEQTVEVTAIDAVFTNGAAYDATVYALMDSGLEAEPFTASFDCAIDSDMDAPIAAISTMYDWSVRIYPSLYKTEEVDGEEVSSLDDKVLFTVFRVGQDGTLDMVQTGVPNAEGVFAVDRHPSFGSMRYRIVANHQETDEVTVTDVEDDNGWDFILIQWDERAGVFDQDDDDVQFAFEYVRLPWNVTVNQQSQKDVAFKHYQGRRHPVALFGTQVGETGSWSCEIIKYEEDEELMKLRKLAAWMGECWVRDSSGLSYPANVDVRINRSWNSRAISVDLEVTRVDEY